MNPTRSHSLTRTTILLLTTALALSALVFGAPQEKVLHTFQGTPGGVSYGGLISDAAGNLFGVTGNSDSESCAPDCGVVFELERTQSAWIYHVLHIFRGGSDGAFPTGLAFDAAGDLYGATSKGNLQQW